MDISIEEQFDLRDVERTLRKCKQFLRFVQENLTVTRIKKELGDEQHLFLPIYLGEDPKFYQWSSRSLQNIFVVIFRFLHKSYPDINRLNLNTKHSEKIREWNVEFPKYLNISTEE